MYTVNKIPHRLKDGASNYMKNNYGLGEGCTGCGLVCNGTVFCLGTVGFPAGALFSNWSLSSLPLVLGINNAEVKHNIATILANSHVPFSSTSVVLFTPIN